MVSTIIDLIKAERLAGYDAQFVDWGGAQSNGKQYSRVGLEYEGITTVSPEWAIEKADILFLHSAIPPHVKATGKPIIVAMHGRPEYSFELERQKRGSCVNLYHHYSRDPQTKAFVSFWQEHIPQWEVVLDEGTKIFCVPAMVNLDKYNPKGKKFDFAPHNGKPNIIIVDVWREDITPFNCLMACAEFIHKHCPEGKVHVFGLSKPNESTAFANILNPLKKKGIVGHTHGLIPYIDDVYRGADFMVTPQVIATRTVREALACGCPIVAGEGNSHTSFTANSYNIKAMTTVIADLWSTLAADKINYPTNRGTWNKWARIIAEKQFSLAKASEHIKQVIEYVVSLPKPKETIVQKPNFKIHNFIAYRPGFKGKDIGKEYNEYMNLISDDNDWACFIDHDAMFTTPNWYDQLYAVIQNNPDYSCFTAVTNRIGNPEQCFASIDKNNHDILYHRDIGQQAQKQYNIQVKDMSEIKMLMSGVVILVKKSAWWEVGGFKEEGFLGVDNDFHKRLNDAGLKTGLMKGVYVYHLYRADGSTGLKPA